MISKAELDRMIREKEDFVIIDVREDYEFEENNLGGVNIPLDTVMENREKIDTTKPVVFCCKSGKRSAAMAHTLERKYQMSNLFTLRGGLESYFESKQ